MPKGGDDTMHLLHTLNNGLWQWVLPFLLPTAAVFCGIATRMAPLRHFGCLLKETYGTLFGKATHTKGPSQRQIFATALAATMGTGNLVGTAAAVSVGGAGALFWMWLSAPIGMLLVYSENLLGIRFRDKNVCGTPAYLKNGVGSALLAGIFSLCCVGASLGMGNMAQTNAMASALQGIGVPPSVSGGVTALLLVGILTGGSRRIGRITEGLMPLLCGGYLLCCLWLILRRAEALPGALLQMLREAFGLRAMGSGLGISAMLHAMSIGIRRGVFSNEAGLGSSAMLHCEAQDTTGHQQGQWAAAEVFADTAICCTATGLVLLTAPQGVIAYGSQDGAALLLAAFGAGFGSWAVWLLAICIALLAFATLIGWYGCGKTAFCYLFGQKNGAVYGMMYITAAFCGALGRVEWIWLLCDFCNGCMALPNLAGLYLLLPELRRLTGTCKNPENML